MPILLLTALLGLLLIAPVGASDHGDVLKARKQGKIAPFGVLVKSARSAAGDGMFLLDADLHDRGSSALVKVYFREQKTGQLVVVTLDARTAAVIEVVDPRSGRGRSRQKIDDRAKSRPNAPAGSDSPGGKGSNAARDGGKNAGGKGGRGGDRSGGHGKGDSKGDRGDGRSSDGGRSGGDGKDGGK